MCISPGKTAFFLLIVVLLPFTGLYGQDVPSAAIVDDSVLRSSLMEAWFMEAPSRVLGKGPVLHRLPGSSMVEVRSEQAGEEFMVILARGRNGDYPGWIQGSWILTRRSDTGEALRIRIFLRSDPYTYVQFRPFGEDRCQMDVVLYEGYVVRSLPVGIPFERLYTMPVEEVLSVVGAKFPRRYFDPDPPLYRDIEQLVGEIRRRLPELRFRDDGAMDEAGRYVFIDTLAEQDEPAGLNCSGFVKWVVDGLLRPVSGRRLTIPPLKKPYGDRGNSFTAPYEESRDPFFGLDWTRNLGTAAVSELRSPAFAALREIEVRDDRAAWVIMREGGRRVIRSYPGFIQDAGFGVEGLHSLLYTLAVDEPGRIYLASVNDEIGPAPRMRQHFHVAVLIPYFNSAGVFQIAVFESAAETSFNAFRNRYPGHYVNLVRIPAEAAFDP